MHFEVADGGSAVPRARLRQQRFCGGALLEVVHGTCRCKKAVLKALHCVEPPFGPAHEETLHEVPRLGGEGFVERPKLRSQNLVNPVRGVLERHRSPDQEVHKHSHCPQVRLLPVRLARLHLRRLEQARPQRARIRDAFVPLEDARRAKVDQLERAGLVVCYHSIVETEVAEDDALGVHVRDRLDELAQQRVALGRERRQLLLSRLEPLREVRQHRHAPHALHDELQRHVRPHERLEEAPHARMVHPTQARELRARSLPQVRLLEPTDADLLHGDGSPVGDARGGEHDALDAAAEALAGGGVAPRSKRVARGARRGIRSLSRASLNVRAFHHRRRSIRRETRPHVLT
mmetsp:Transcript_30505/g.99146  ORF Transcript_30505/g.99146 Transcript_30505/m.99146 type:complete len:347 (+) Transcript_30505:888-1928(+)